METRRVKTDCSRAEASDQSKPALAKPQPTFDNANDPSEGTKTDAGVSSGSCVRSISSVAVFTRQRLHCGIDVPGLTCFKHRLQIASARFSFRGCDLFRDLDFESRSRDVAKDTDRLREMRVSHSREHERNMRRLGRFIVEQQIVFGDTCAKLNDFGHQAVEANAFVAILAKDHRLAMFEDKQIVVFGFAIGGILPCTVVEDVAVLVDLNEARALVHRGSMERVSQVLGVEVDASRDEGGFGSNRYRERAERIVDAAHWRALRDVPLRRRRRVLAFGQSVDAVVEHHDVEIDVASNAMHQVIASDAQRIAVTRDYKNREVRPRDFESRSKGWRSTVDRVHAVGVHVVRESA